MIILGRLYYNLADENKEDKTLSQAVFSYFLIIAANASIKTAFGLVDTSYGAMLSLFAYIILFFFLIRGLKHVIKRNKSLLFKSYLFFFIIFAISCLINIADGRSTRLIIEYNLLWNFATWIPIGCCACCVKDKSVLYKTGINYSYFITLFLFLTFFKNNGTISETGSDQYDMSFGFSMMLPLILHLNEFKRNKNFVIGCLGLIELLALLAYGNRGALLSVIFYVIASLWTSMSNVALKTAVVIFVVAVGSILFSYLNDILINLASLFSSTALFEHSRTVGMLVSGAMQDESGRDILRQISLDMIHEKPLLGWGLGGEYFEIARRYSGTVGMAVTQAHNPHNGLIQNMVNFGVLGGIVANLFCIIPYLGLKKYRDKYMSDLLLVFCSLNFPRMISATGFFVNPDAAILLYLFYCTDNVSKR